MAVDVWLHHPTARFVGHDMLESPRRWTGVEPPDQDPPIDGKAQG